MKAGIRDSGFEEPGLGIGIRKAPYIPRVAVARMMTNIAIDTLIGSIPLLGDAFDFAFKANRRNVALLRRHLGRD